MNSDVIAAIATAPGRGGVAVIRVSGPEAFEIAKKICGKAPQPGRIQFAQFRQPNDARHATRDMRGADGAGCLSPLLDEGLLLSFKAPHSYTGEDVVEFQCHGGSVTSRRILEACFAAGARLARRGEFTERAFLNGKLALDQAQAVLDLIDAKTDRAADAALGELVADPTRRDAASPSGTLREIYEAALNVSSTLEHALDIDEGELPEDFYDRVTADIAAVRTQLVAARTRARERALLRQGVLVVLAGPPNAGKSSLLNALVGANRAIVSDVPGTTRDAVEVWLDLEGWPVRLVDTAGLRETGDAIEAEGVKRSEALIAEAQVIIDLGGARVSAAAQDKVISVLSKCDLLPTFQHPNSSASQPLRVSAKTGEGLEELKRAVVAKLESQVTSFSEDTGNAQEALLLEVLSLLDALPVGSDRRGAQGPARPTAGVADNTLDLVLTGNLLQRVCAKLGAELGVTYSEDLLDRIFSRFCVGK